MLVTVISVLVGGLGLTSLIDSLTGSELTSAIINGIWSVLQFVVEPFINLFSLIWDKLIDIVSALF